MLTTETIYVQNIHCSNCMNKIVNTLIKIEGVHDVSVFKEEGKVNVVGSNLPINHIVQQLEELGYPPQGNNSMLKQAKTFISYAFGSKVK